MEEEDLYLVLGIENGGPEVSQLEVRKSYRTRALLCHPDKRREDAAAAALEFDKLQKAYEVLGYEKARKVYDDLRKLRESRLEKEKLFSRKRQRMIEKLRDRERTFEMQSREKREEEEASKRLKVEIAHIAAMRSKKESSVGFQHSYSSQSKDPFQKQGSARQQAAAATPAQTSELENTLKASWSCQGGGGGGYTAARLIEIFQEFGPVEDVVIRQSASRKKGSALVVMGSKEAARAATGMQCGDFSNPILVVPAMPITKSSTEEVIAQAAPTQLSGVNTTVGSGYRSFENEILAKMKKEAERRRARISKEMEEADAKAA